MGGAIGSNMGIAGIYATELTREGILAALAMGRDRLDPPIIVEALKDKGQDASTVNSCIATERRCVPSMSRRSR